MYALYSMSAQLIIAVVCLLFFAGTTLSASTAPIEQKQEQSKEITVQDFFDEATGIDFVWVEGGCYSMGIQDGKQEPAHEVCVGGFWIGKSEVTRAQWQKILDEPSGGTSSQLPVADVSWNDLDYYLGKLRERTGETYRLPTESEWEFAARGGIKHDDVNAGDTNKQKEVAWCNEDDRDQPYEVMTKQPNALGIYDMRGNVAEWCRDWYHHDYYRSSPTESPFGPVAGTLRVMRGGSWLGSNLECRVSERDAYPPEAADETIGFRLVLPGKQKRDNFYDEIASMMFIWVEGGCFQMGSTQGATDENPVHDVCVDGFWLGETEVTGEQWQKIMLNNPSTFAEPTRPVTDISWNGAKGYFSRLGNLAGRTYRFPTEAEWEYAARGGNKSNATPFSGSALINEVAWFSSNTEKEPVAVRQKKPNELGFYDMSGNVAEFCNDIYRAGAYSRSKKINPKGPETGIFKVIRGGNWLSGPESCRVSSRGSTSSSGGGAYIGLRVALSADQVDLNLLDYSDDEQAPKLRPTAATKEPGLQGPSN